MQYNINLHVDLPSIAGQQLGQLLDAYLADLGRRVQPKTVDNRRYKLAHFRAWWRAVGPDLGWRLTPDALADFGRHLDGVVSVRGRVLAYDTRRDVLRFLAMALRWAHQRGVVGVDFSLYVPRPRGAPPVRRPVDLQALGQLLGATRATRMPARNAAIVALLAGCGLRCEEAAAIQAHQVAIYANGSGVLQLQVAKFDRPRLVAFDQATGAHLDGHLAAVESGPLCTSQKGGQLSPSGLRKVVASLAAIAGVADVVRGPQDLRRLYATSWARALPGHGLLLQRQMGHASWDTTQAHYIAHDVGSVLDVIESQPVSPMAQLVGA